MELFLKSIPVATVLFVTLMRCIELRKRRDIIPGRIVEKRTLQLLVLNGFAVLGASLLEYFLRQKSLAILPYTLGVILAIASFTIRRRAIAALGNFWSLHVEIRYKHRFVKSGPFRWVRHPTYLSMVLELFCGLLILNSYWASLLIMTCFAPLIVIRIKIEERMLIRKFGPAYRDYMREVPALLPWKAPSRTTNRSCL